MDVNAFMESLLTGYDAPLLVVFLTALLVTPLLPILVIAPFFENRALPLNPKDGQFYTFVYGDIALAVTATLLVATSRADEFVPIASWWIWLVAGATVVVAILMTAMEYADAKAGKPFAYAPRAVLSPTKLYHNLVLYAGYTWLLVMLLTESVMMVVHNADRHLDGSIMIAAALFFAGLWGWTMVLDNQSSPEQKQRRAEKAHVATW